MAAGGGDPNDPNKNNRNQNKKDKKEEEEKKRKKSEIKKTEFFQKKEISNNYRQFRDNIYKIKDNGKRIHDAEYIEWDFLHDEVELYNNGGKTHLGALDPKSMFIYKKPVVNRRLIL